MASAARLVTLVLASSVLSVGLVKAGFLRKAFEGCVGIDGSNDYASEYDKIDQMLQSFDSSIKHSVKEQMREVVRLVDEGKATQDCYGRALEQVFKLVTVIGYWQCTPTSVEILRANILATRNQAKLAEPTRLIDRLVKHHIQEHADLCGNRYVNMFRSLDLDKQSKRDLYDRVYGYTDTVMAEVLEGKTVGLRPDIAMGQFRLSEIEVAGATLKYLKGVVSGNERDVLDSNTDMSKSKRKSLIGDIIRTYLVEPCEYYLRLMDEDIFEPYDFDFPEENKVPANAEVDFFRGRARRLICKALVNKESKILHEKLFRGVTGE